MAGIGLWAAIFIFLVNTFDIPITSKSAGIVQIEVIVDTLEKDLKYLTVVLTKENCKIEEKKTE